MKKALLIALCFSFIQHSFSQRQFNNWYFGYGCGITFNSGTAALIDSTFPMNTDDNSACISDYNGNVLFYANGTTAYDKQGNVMSNGGNLAGNLTGGQTATIVQLPGSRVVYYLFTVDAMGWSGGVSYSVVDMSLNSGLGDIITAQKNVSILTQATEKIVPIRHANGVDVWIVVHEWNSDAYRSYLLTAAGLSTNPVITHIGSISTGGYSPGYNAMGQITVNKANDMIAAATYSDGIIELFDFDNQTGVLSNRVEIPQYRAWGLEFSNSGQYLYSTGWTESTIYQYDLSDYSDSSVLSSQVSIGTCPGQGYLQTGPDGRIYVAKYQSNYLGVINSPNNAGSASDFVDQGFSMGTHVSSAGLVDKILYNFTPSGINDQDGAVALSCYPSPSTGSFTIDMSGLADGNKQATVYSAVGQIAYQAESTLDKIVVNNTLAAGFYTVVVRQGSKNYTAKVVVK